ncbi:MAG: DUF3243 domain-containing protein [Vallitaleaceae bacterium]|nr:DUF3243 domain-containing protein [Vallitaleaceae bacterium]
MDTLRDWDKWKASLKKAVDLGETIGMSDQTITNAAEKVGTFLSNHVDPRNDEERLLKEMWDVADDSDKQVLAKIVTRMVD